MSTVPSTAKIATHFFALSFDSSSFEGEQGISFFFSSSNLYESCVAGNLLFLFASTI